MAIAPTHLFGGVAHEFIDEPLVDGMRCEIADKRMPQAVPPSDDIPFAVLQDALIVVVRFVTCKRPG